MRVVAETRRPVVEVARELGIGAGTLSNWVRKDRAERSGEVHSGQGGSPLDRLSTYRTLRRVAVRLGRRRA